MTAQEKIVLLEKFNKMTVKEKIVLLEKFDEMLEEINNSLMRAFLKTYLPKK